MAQTDLLVCIGTYEQALIGYRLTLSSSHVENTTTSSGSTQSSSPKSSQYTFAPDFGPERHHAALSAIDISGPFLATGSTNELIHIYNLVKRREIGICNQHSATITSIQISGESVPPSMISSDEGGNILFWKSRKGGSEWTVVKTIHPHPTSISSLVMHPSGRMAFAVSSKDRALALINLLNGKLASRIHIKSKSGIQNICWSPSGYIYAISSGSDVLFYDLRKGTDPTDTLNISFPIVSMQFASVSL